GYQMDNRGEFLGPPAESFEIHVERIAVGWQFGQLAQSRPLVQNELRDPAFRDLFETRLRNARIAEASDRYSTYYMTDRYLVVEDTTKGILRRARVAQAD